MLSSQTRFSYCLTGPKRAGRLTGGSTRASFGASLMISLQVASVIGASRRRGWPLRPQFRKSDLTLKAIRRHREQLWAEAARGSPDNEGAFGATLPVGRFCPRSAPEQG